MLKIISIFGISLMFTFVAAETREEVIARFRVTADQCRTETNATDADVQELFAQQPPSTRSSKCFRACIMKKFGVMNANGRLDKAVTLRILSDLVAGNAEELRKGEEILNICSILIVPIDECEAENVYGVCLRREAQRLGTDFIFVW